MKKEGKKRNTQRTTALPPGPYQHAASVCAVNGLTKVITLLIGAVHRLSLKALSALRFTDMSTEVGRFPHEPRGPDRPVCHVQQQEDTCRTCVTVGQRCTGPQ